MASTLSVTSPADFHVHLRQGSMAALVTPHVRKGGFNLAYVMPNLKPPIKTTAQALEYKAELEKLDPSVEYLMTLYLSPDLTPDEIRKAKKAGIVGVKSYPRGVTTNSDGGIESYETYYPVFEAMQEVDMVLNLHGEVPSDPTTNTHVLNAEAKFLHHLHRLHNAFPSLRIVLEHATTRAAVEAVKACSSTVACTITAHHLALTVDDWAGQSYHFCKPVPKFPEDRLALREIIQEGHPRFFLGSDSAPHPEVSKSTSTPLQGCAAGIYTSPILLPLVAHLLESFGALDKLEGFVSNFGRAFYKREAGADSSHSKVMLQKIAEEALIDDRYVLNDDVVVPFWAGKEIGWKIVSELPMTSGAKQ
ncbi:Dihydroorotase [Tricholoma matsutake]|nr:Dihydroorotase [Tricholoma matsutake 945]